jgi:hypothetical protein
VEDGFCIGESGAQEQSLRDNTLMSLLDDIHELQARHSDAGRYERMALDLAASLLEEIHRRTTGNLPDKVTRWSVEDYYDVPERYELLDHRVVPKRWKINVDTPSGAPR